ncbi:hypothetical protein [Kozakia baliensis]|uniref:hypothetical protein n=1 Tax=Kozakia baliensis TaxID=153496 RepID=UPI0012454AF3|nr:hypothetical protein [Kozakia baliensis]
MFYTLLVHNLKTSAFGYVETESGRTMHGTPGIKPVAKTPFRHPHSWSLACDRLQRLASWKRMG